MSASLRAFFAAADEAEEARAFVERRVALTGSAIVDRGSIDALGEMGLAGEAVAEAAAELEGGGVLLVLVVADRAELAEVRAALDAHRGAARASNPEVAAAESAGPGLLMGEPLVVRSHARVEMFAEAEEAPEAAASSEVPVASEAVAAAELFAGRVLEFAEAREEAAVSRRMAVREELVVRKFVTQRVERVTGSVRRTDEMDVEELAPRAEQARASLVPTGAEPYEPPA